MLAHEALSHLKSQTGFQALGEAVGNLTLGRGQLGGTQGHVAIVENRIASGSLGAKESDKLASLFKVAAAQKAPLLMYLDSAGARISEGLPALGAFRHMYRAALNLAATGVPVTAVCGANCFGGASMLASLAGARYFSANTRFAMSGPAILAQSAGASVLDDMFQAMAQSAIGMDARVKVSADNHPAGGDTIFSRLQTGQSPQEQHAALASRLAPLRAAQRTTVAEKIERKDLAKLYPQGYSVVEKDGIVSGEAHYQGKPVRILGLINGRLLGAVSAWALADEAWKLLPSPPGILHLLVDAESHATTLDDERVVLSAYLADLAQALFSLERAGVRIETTVLGMLGGGVYVALAAPATQVNLLYGMEIQLLPGKAIASILGEASSDKVAFDEYRKARVAEQELKLGLV